MIIVQLLGGVFGWCLVWAIVYVCDKREELKLERDLKNIRKQYEKN